MSKEDKIVEAKRIESEVNDILDDLFKKKKGKINIEHAKVIQKVLNTKVSLARTMISYNKMQGTKNKINIMEE